MDEPLTAIDALLAAANAHEGVPDETRSSLRQLAVQVRELADACHRLVSAQSAPSEGCSRRSTPPVVNLTRRDPRPGEGFAGLLDLEPGGAREGNGADRAALDPSLAEQVLERVRPSGTPVPKELAKLTPQEQRILNLIAQGCTNRQIAQRLFLAEKTVKNYVSNMLRKLGMERRTQAAVFATNLDQPRWAEAAGGSRPA